MRRMLFDKGVISSQSFENRVREMAMLSQEREGIRDPYNEEAAEIWD